MSVTSSRNGAAQLHMAPYSMGYQGEKNLHKYDNGLRLMDVSVSVLGLTGIMMESKGRRKKNKNKRSYLGERSASSSYSTDDDDGFPVKAVVSFFKQVNNSKTSIASHLPSMKIRETETNDAVKSRFIATWQTDFDPMGNELSTFKFSRMMQIEDAGLHHKFRSSHTPMMVPERVQLTVGLTRGSEIITLGSATLVITGEEAQDVQVNLPISFEKGDGKPKKKSVKTFFKSTSFVNDPQKKYNFHGNSCLKVLVRATPSEPVLSNRNRSQDVPRMIASASSSRSRSRSNGSEEISHHQHSHEQPNHMRREQPTHLRHEKPNHMRYEQPNHMRHEQPNHMRPVYHPANHMHQRYSYDTRDEMTVQDSETADDTASVDYTVDDTIDETVDTMDTRPSSLSLLSNYLSCGGNMCTTYPRTSPSDNESVIPAHKSGNQGKTGWLPPLKVFANMRESMCKRNTVNVDEDLISYEEYKKRMMATPRKSNTNHRRKSGGNSVATEKMKNLGYDQEYGHYYENNGELDEAKHQMEMYATRTGIDPYKMI